MNVQNYSLFYPPFMKDQVTKSRAASNHAESILSVLRHAFNYARTSRDQNIPINEIPPLNISPYSSRTLITGSFLDQTGKVGIPGLLWMMDSLCLSLFEMVSVFQENSPYAKPDLFNRAKEYILSYRDPDAFDNDVVFSTIESQDTGSPYSLCGLIKEIRQNLDHIERNIPSEQVGGADCYQIFPEDRFLIRSFMLGIHAIYPNGHKHTPKVCIIRKGTELEIKFIPVEKNRPTFFLNIVGLVGTVNLQGVKTDQITKYQSQFKKYLNVWRDIKQDSDSRSETPDVSRKGMYSSFHARSYDELMQFLTYTSHQMSFSRDYSPVSKA